MEFCLLGPLIVRDGGAVVPVPHGQQRSVLAALLLNANRVVSLAELAETLWGSAPPSTARVAVQNHVMRLRKTLPGTGGSRISTQPPGYMIRVDPAELDVARFEDLLVSARAAARGSSWDAAARDARQALALWRDEPLTDVQSELLAMREGPRLAELRLQALELRIDADLQLGHHHEAISELLLLAGAHPLRERLHALLMLALYRDGRQAEALAAYQDARQVLISELGSEPGSGLRDLHQRMLAADPALAAPLAASPTAGDAGPVVPRELPAGIRHFTGRVGELEALTRLLDEAGADGPGTLVISAIGGTAGVGKTALAVHWGRREAARFPDGQLYVNLRGFDPAADPLSPADALRGFLDALRVPAAQIPVTVDGRQNLYRSLLDGKRILVLLDNARHCAQVRPLLPRTPGCVVLITSRNDLTGLVVAEDARMFTLDVLTATEARQLLAARLGDVRVAAEPAAVDELIALCARLPLALSITAARVAARSRFPLAALADELRAAHGRLDGLCTGDDATDLRATFDWSYQQLSPDAARMFRLLGLHPGPDITASAAASLAGLHQLHARRLLRELTRGHLLAEPAPGRYTLHDLMRVYAAGQAEAADDEQTRRAAIGRMLDHYLHTAHTAALLLKPSREPVALAAARPGVTPEHLTGHQQALVWFDAEHHVLLSVTVLAAGSQFDVHAWQIPWALADFFNRRGHWHGYAAIERTALDAATRLGDTAAQASACRALGTAYTGLGEYDLARARMADGLALYLKLGDSGGQARAHQILSMVADRQSRYRDALDHAEQALHLFRAIGDQAGQAGALNAVGWCHAMLGDPRQARICCQRALALHSAAGSRTGEANTWDSLGYAEHQLGRLTEAADCYQHALSLFRELGDRFNEAEILTHLGETRRAANSRRDARDAWQQALDIFDDLRHPAAAHVRAKIEDLNA